MPSANSPACWGPLLALGLLLLAAAGCSSGPRAAAGEPPPPGQGDYPREEIVDESVGRDEALVNVRVAIDRWPDCTTLRSTVEDVFRLEGVGDKRDEDKALALWKWMRVLLSATGGSYAWEGPAGAGRIVHDPHRILTCYGHHQCDGLSWTMVPIWRAAGYMAFDECTPGHTISSLRYRDDDGQMRYHDFDLQGRFYYWDDQHKRVGTWTVPLIRGRVHRHVLAPQKLHSLRTSLRPGEAVARLWDNTGHIVPGRPSKETDEKALATEYYLYRQGRTDGVYAAAGEELQTLEADLAPGRFAAQLFAAPENAAASAPEAGRATLHPVEAGKPAVLVWRLAPPYPIVEARIEAELVSSAAEDLCRLSISTDGKKWQPVFTKDKPGAEKAAVELGRAARAAGRPDAYTAYDLYVKAEFRTAGDVRGVGLTALRLSAWRMLNKRALPNLRQGENVVCVAADRLAPGTALELVVDYAVDGKPQTAKQVIAGLPHYFRIDVRGEEGPGLSNYDKHFNDGTLRMSAIRMRLVPLAGAEPSKSLPEAEGRRRFAQSSPHPGRLEDRKIMKKVETDLAQTCGFFPQGGEKLDDDAAMAALVKRLEAKKVPDVWLAAEDLGSYPKAVDALCAALPKADIDLTLFICKALARIRDRKAVGPLLEKWKRGEAGSPGTRYIPDALAAIGDRSVVPELVAPLHRMRFDFRFHIAHALGILGGPEAEKALEDLAANDPLRAVREEATEGLKKLRAAK